MSHNSLPFELFEGEKIIEELDAHWTWILPTLAKATIAIVFYLSLAYLAPDYFFGASSGRIISLLIVMGIVGYVVIMRKKHHFSRFIITNLRLVEIDRHRFLHAQIYEVPYDHIQSVRALKHGFWGTLFNYGTLIINTAGEEGQFEFGGNRLVNPGKVQSVILITRDEFLKNLGSYNAVLSRPGTPDSQSASYNTFVNFFKAMQTMPEPTQSSKPVAGFTVSDEEDESDKTTNHSDNSYLVSMLSRAGNFKKNVIKSLAEEINNDGNPRGHRLVKTVTSSPHFKKKVTDDLKKELLN